MTDALARLSFADLSSVRLETLAAPSNIGGLAIVDAGPLVDASGRLRLGMIRRRVEARLSRVGALRRRVYHPGLFRGLPVWVDDRAFDIRRHVLEAAVPAPGGVDRLLDTCNRLMGQLIDRAHPLWQLWFLTGLDGDHVGVLLKLHHAIADGQAVLAMVAALFDSAPDAPDPAPRRWVPRRPPPGARLLADSLRTKADAAAEGVRLMTRPRQTAATVRATWHELSASLRATGAAPRSSINQPLRPGRVTRHLAIDLGEAHAIAHAAGGKVNDAVLDMVAGGLRDLLLGRGELAPGDVLMASVPVSLRPGTRVVDLGNHVGVMVVPLPVSEPDPGRRLETIVRASREAKTHQQPAYGQSFMGLLAALPLGRTFIAHQRMVNVFVTNVVGPATPLFVLGSRVREIVPLPGLAGNVTVLFCALSYDGRLELSVTVDQHACPEIDRVKAGMEMTWRGLRTAALPSRLAG